MKNMGSIETVATGEPEETAGSTITPEELHLKLIRFASRVGDFGDGCHDASEPINYPPAGSGHVTYKKTDRGSVATFIDETV